jgi:glutathione synthase/RimK-type ligase-like ATP-grasp enzyme
MKGWVILVDGKKDADGLLSAAMSHAGSADASKRYSIVTTREYLAKPEMFRGIRPKVINLSRSYTYQSRGYYSSLLAEARGHRVIPSVETMIELDDRMLYARALPELEASLKSCLKVAQKSAQGASANGDPMREPSGEGESVGLEVPSRLLICFGQTVDERFERFARLLFDWFRAPVLEVRIESPFTQGDDDKPDREEGESPGRGIRIKRIASRAAAKLEGEELSAFCAALDAHTQREWRSPRAKNVARYSFATLYDPDEKMPPSSPETLRHWARIAEKMSVEVEPITKRDLARLAEFDALFIRETTSIDNHTYRFARRAVQEGMPVIDDPISMIRCTNKVFLQELLAANGVPVPPSVIISRREDLVRAADELGFPMVVKIPDSSFSLGVRKVDGVDELKVLVKAWLVDSDLILAQRFMPTSFDWRVGVLGGRALFVSQYKMARAHWQIVNHKPDGRSVEGGFRTPRLIEAPPEVIDIGLKAATLIGYGLYGVDLKETPDGVVVIEVNDNPNLDHGVEDLGEKDAIWRALTRWFIERIEA